MGDTVGTVLGLAWMAFLLVVGVAIVKFVWYLV